MFKKQYTQEDLILPILKLPDPCPIKIVVTDKDVQLFVGPRDWQWERITGRFIGAGTSTCKAQIENSS